MPNTIICLENYQFHTSINAKDDRIELIFIENRNTDPIRTIRVMINLTIVNIAVSANFMEGEVMADLRMSYTRKSATTSPSMIISHILSSSGTNNSSLVITGNMLRKIFFVHCIDSATIGSFDDYSIDDINFHCENCCL